jgi:amino-acid N-acetyltransferase
VFLSGIKLTDATVDLPKLVALIEDSFGKTLDVAHYLNRINDHIAGHIIAGDYEGAAIVTWETLPANSEAKVCYLDKFAVAKRSQGVGDVGDVVFKAMTAGVRPDGLFEGAEGIVWRSRTTNVVNKWVRPVHPAAQTRPLTEKQYFERAKGVETPRCGRRVDHVLVHRGCGRRGAALRGLCRCVHEHPSEPDLSIVLQLNQFHSVTVVFNS